MDCMQDRTALLLGDSAVAQLSKAHVMVIGLGEAEYLTQKTPTTRGRHQKEKSNSQKRKHGNNMWILGGWKSLAAKPRIWCLATMYQPAN